MSSFSKSTKNPSTDAIRIHDVFLSFRGGDTRASFTSHLYASLQNAGITVFRDDDSLQRGDHISTSINRAIEESRISIIVFSRNYADSRWCLDELMKIMKCHKTIGQVVFPVFYNVDPSEVRHQTGEFGKAFQSLSIKFSNNERLCNMYDAKNALLKFDISISELEKRWIRALQEAAELAGFVVQNFRNESEAIKDIVKKVTLLIEKSDLFVANNPVGVERRVRDMTQMLDIKQSNDVLLLGIWGMGGIGKTTIAKAIYNKIGRNFNYKSFLANIREVWEQNVGQVSLQEQIIFDICKVTTKIHSIEAGKRMLMDKLCHKRVLLVLDDVNTLDQMNVLCGSRRWFSPGSIIIITTRDVNILGGNRADQVYTMKEMNKDESIELFSWHAFKLSKPKKEFAVIFEKVVEYSGGLPLALEVIGSYLYNRNLTEWECVLKKLKKYPNDQVHKRLKISYDGLNDVTVKDIFLDIACFLIGMDRNDVILILDGCGLFAEIGISILVERSLVIVDGENKLRMHDLLRDMGREIIYEKSPEELEKRCRLWFPKDVLDVLFEKTGTKATKGLALKLPIDDAQCFSTEAFKNMKSLKLLQLAGVQLNGNFADLSRNLRLLSWNGFSSTHIPKNFDGENLVSIELEHSNVKLVWKEAKMMENLKILNLSHSHCLTHSPDFSYLPNLEKLVLVDCRRLCEVSHSIGYLKKILLINLKDCISLRSLPRSIYKLKSLKALILSGCSKIEKLEEDIEQMESLTTLLANDTAIKRVPFSLVRSKSIGYISLCGYEGFSRNVFPSIIRSWMSPTTGLLSSVRTSTIMSLSSCVPLYVSHNGSNGISSMSKYLPSLRSLWVQSSSELQLSHDSAIILDALYATDYKELEPTATTSQESRSKYFFKSLLIQMGMSFKVTNNLKEKILQNMDVNGRLPGDSYPDWITFSSEDSSVTFEVPQVEDRNLKTMMCVVYTSSPDNLTSDGLKNVLVINHTKATIQLYKSEALASFEDKEGQRVVSSIEPGNKVEVVVVFGKSFIVKNTRIYLVYDRPIADKLKLHCVSELDVIACSGDENECAAKRMSTQEEPTNDFNQNRKKKNQVERKMVKQWLAKNQFLWFLKAFVLATIVFHLWLKFLDFFHGEVM